MKTKLHESNNETGKSSPDLKLREHIERQACEIREAGGSRRGEDATHWLQAESEGPKIAELIEVNQK